MTHFTPTRRDLIKSAVTAAAAGATALITSRASGALTENGKTWGVSNRPHFDRAMAPWAIKRFVDKNAKFVFGAKIEDLPKDAIPIGFSTGELSQYDPAGGTCFHKTVAKYKIDDPAVLAMERMNTQALVWSRANRQPGVDWKKQPVPVDMSDRYARWGFGMLGLADAFAHKAKSNQEMLDLNFPIYDALYELISAELKKKA